MKKNDIKLAFIIVFISVIFIVVRFLFSSADNNTMAVVYRDSDKIADVLLSEDAEFTVDSYSKTLGNGYNHIIVSDNKIWVDDSDCPDKLCVLQGKISLAGESIICLPHRISIEIIKGKEREVDGVSGR